MSLNQINLITKVSILSPIRVDPLPEKHIGCYGQSEPKDIIGAAFYVKTYSVDNVNMTFQFWDISPDNRFRHMIQPYLSGSLMIVVFIDSTEGDVIDELIELLNLIDHHSIPFPIVIIEKCASLDEGPTERILHICNNFNVVFYVKTFDMEEKGIIYPLLDFAFAFEHEYEYIERPLDREVFLPDLEVTEYTDNTEMIIWKNTLIFKFKEKINNSIPVMIEIRNRHFTENNRFPGLFYPVRRPSPGEIEEFNKFAVKYAKCIVCGRDNHRSYLKSLYFSERPEIIRIKRMLDSLEWELDMYPGKYGNIRIGIPCCDCYDKYIGMFEGDNDTFPI